MSTLRIGWRTSEQAARAKAAERERDDLKAKLAAEREKVARLTEALQEYQTAERRERSATETLRQRLADPEWVDIAREAAWMKAGAKWNNAEGRYEIPAGWPPGLDAELAIAADLGLVKERYIRATDEAPATNGANGNPFGIRRGKK